MLFLMEYNRPQGKLISFRSFPESDRRIAEDARLDLELELLRRGVNHEVVILGAESEAALRKGYRRYFEDFETLLHSTAQAMRTEGEY